MSIFKVHIPEQNVFIEAQDEADAHYEAGYEIEIGSIEECEDEE